MLGYKSRTSVYAAIKNDPDFPKPVRRGRSVFFFRNESLAYLEQLRARRSSTELNDVGSQTAIRMLAGKRAKKAAAEQRRAVHS